MRILILGFWAFVIVSLANAQTPIADSNQHRILNTAIDQPLQFFAQTMDGNTLILDGKGELLKHFTSDFGESFNIKSLGNVGTTKQAAISPDGQQLAGFRTDGELYLRSLHQDASEVSLDKLQTMNLELLQVGADNRQLVVVTKTGERLVYDLMSKKKIGSNPISERIRKLGTRAYDATGRYAVFFDENEGLVLADTISGDTTLKFKTTEWSTPSFVKFSEDGQYLAAVYSEQPNQFWLWNRKEPERPILFKQDQEIRDIKLPNNDTLGFRPNELGIIYADGTARIFDIDTQNLLVQFKTIISPLTPCQLDFKNRRLQVLDADKKQLLLEQAPLTASAAPEMPESYVKIVVNYATNRSTMNELEGTVKAQAKILFSSIIVKLVAGALLLGLLMLLYFRHFLYCGFGAFVLIAISWIFLWERADQIAKHPLANQYNSELGEVKFGQCSITIPERRGLGEIPIPKNWLLYEEPANPEKHFILQNLREMPEREWCSEINNMIEEKKHQEALIFVHGFNVDFEQAIFRTAQLGVDLKIHGPVFCFSWPSYGLGTHYLNDGTHAEQSIASFQKFLWAITDKIKTDRIHIIAHSMGNRLVCNAIKDASMNRVSGLSKVQQIVLAAPDVDKKFFEVNYIPNFAPQPPITLYASSRDGALQISQAVNGDPRLGDTRPEIYTHSRLISIDASDVITGALGHSYFGDERELLMDLRCLFNGIPPAERLGLQWMDNGSKSFWKIQP